MSFSVVKSPRLREPSRATDSAAMDKVRQSHHVANHGSAAMRRPGQLVLEESDYACCMEMSWHLGLNTISATRTLERPRSRSGLPVTPRARSRTVACGPVLVGHGGFAESCHFVVGYKGSPGSRAALTFAAALGDDLHDAKLTIAYATPLSSIALMASGMPCTIPSLLGHEDEMAADIEEQAAYQLVNYAVQWRFVHRRGDIAGQLLQLAEDVDASAIVVGRSHRPCRRIIGSVPARLRRCAPQLTVVPDDDPR